MKKKILYLFSDTGGGHRSAATAIINAIEHLEPGKYHQEMVDAFATSSKFLNVFARLYAPVIKYSPQLWGHLYYWLDDERKLKQLEKIARPFIREELAKLIRKVRPDLIVSVHPMINHLTASVIRDLNARIPFALVVTDPVTLHRAWITPDVDLCLVATEDAKKLAVRYGMPEHKIKVCGMPIDPKFFLKIKDKNEKLEADGLSAGTKTVLLMGGGEGGGGMYELIKELDRENLDIQLIIVCGRNQRLEKKLKENKEGLKIPLKVYGFTDKIPDIMATSDLIITKAGPGSIAEALAMNLPIIITSWLPGQEEGNVSFVVKENVGRVTKDPKKVARLVKEMLSAKELAILRENIKRARKPHAALDIAEQLLTYLK